LTPRFLVVDTVCAICRADGATVSRFCMFNNGKAVDTVTGLDLTVCARVPEMYSVSAEGR